jgi:hypothetical protein
VQVSPQTLIVKKVSSSKNRFSATFAGESPQAGQSYAHTDELGEICRATVKELKSSYVILEVNQCPGKADLKEGLSFELSSGGKSKNQTPGKKSRFGFFLFYNFADSIYEKGTIKIGSQSHSFEGEESTSGAPGLGVSMQHRFSKNWGLEYSAAYEASRTIDSYKIVYNGTTLKGNYTDKPKFTVLFLQGNARFFASKYFYLLAGINLGKYDLKNADGVTVGTAYGGQAGVGYELPSGFSFETQYRVMTASGSFDDSTAAIPVTMDYDYFTLGGVVFLVRYSL